MFFRFFRCEVNKIKLNIKKLDILIGVSIIIFFVMLVINTYLPLLSDDLIYKNFLWTDTPITNLAGVIKTEKDFYLLQGGRVPAQTIGQIFLLMSKKVFNVFNSFMFVALLSMLYINVTIGIKNKDDNNDRKDITLFLLISVLTWFGIPRFSETVGWLMGSVNYLWTTTILLIFVYNFKKLSYNKNNLNIVITVLLGLISGWTNENMSVAILISCVLYITIEKIRNTKIFVLMSSYFVGVLLLLLAPGNSNRAFMEGKRFIYTEPLDLYYYVIDRLNFFISKMSEVFMSSPLVITIFILCLVYLIYNKELIRKFYFELLIILLSYFAMLGTPTYPMRANFGIIIFMVLLIAKIFYSCYNNNSEKIRVILFLILMLGLYATYKSYYVIYETDLYSERRVTSSNGSVDIENPLPPIFTKNNIEAFIQTFSWEENK